ncbi:probable serine carboxypeptidase CPVL isoform X1 [Phyllostomus hastatus]|uniref:probable serine carboxypeptidase CPVL isoform X1 n=1 Tax=Phyllostomus hastatus TaxID=9423 RepID=UPI001E68383C|nr:probable serine carboxypeptidase CPVL isoform X1 [Phyllostomus hastatus]
MWKEAVLLALLMLCPSGRGLFYFGSGNTHGSVPCDGGDKGQPLYLTPYIEAGKVVEGRRLSAVPPLQGLDLVSYCGFLTVNKTYNSNLFFWFFPAKMQSSTAPLVVWLQGGPGSSSLFGLFMENGPFAVTKNLTLYLRDFAWTSTLSMLYIDNPVGAGFSFTDDPQGYASNEDDVARDLFSALMQFFQLFPEFQENDFYITGQSYAGKYVPAIAYYIHTLNPTLSLPINLKGIAIGSGFCHPESVLRGYASAMYEMGLLDENQRKYVEEQSQEALEHLKKREWSQALEVFNRVLTGDNAYMVNVTGCPDLSNIVQCVEPEEYSYFRKFLALSEVRRAIHVGNHTFNDGSEVKKHLEGSSMWSALPWLAELMNNYKVLLYNGQLDVLLPASLTERFLMVMNWKGSQEYRRVERKIWKILKSDQEVAGYVRQVGNFHQLIVRGGGHNLPFDQPLRAYDMINRFIYEKGWDPY